MTRIAQVPPRWAWDNWQTQQTREPALDSGSMWLQPNVCAFWSKAVERKDKFDKSQKLRKQGELDGSMMAFFQVASFLMRRQAAYLLMFLLTTSTILKYNIFCNKSGGVHKYTTDLFEEVLLNNLIYLYSNQTSITSKLKSRRTAILITDE